MQNRAIGHELSVLRETDGVSSSISNVNENTRSAGEISTAFNIEQREDAKLDLDDQDSKRRLHVRDLLAFEDVEFIWAAYSATLGRPPDEDGLGCYLRMLRDGASKIEILGRLRSSAEGMQRGFRIRGLWLLYMLDRICRLPVVGRIMLVATGVWNLPGYMRTNRRLINEKARGDAENEQRFRDIYKALRVLEQPARRANTFSEVTLTTVTTGTSPSPSDNSPKTGEPRTLSSKEMVFRKGAPELLPAVVEAILEIRTRFGEPLAIEFAYIYILGRRADSIGLMDKCRALATKRSSLQDICIEMLASEEYQRRRVVQHRDPYATITSWSKVDEA